MLRLAEQVPTLARQRSHVSMSIDKPRNRSSGGAKISALDTTAMARTATASGSRRDMRGIHCN